METIELGGAKKTLNAFGEMSKGAKYIAETVVSARFALHGPSASDEAADGAGPESWPG